MLRKACAVMNYQKMRARLKTNSTPELSFSSAEVEPYDLKIFMFKKNGNERHIMCLKVDWEPFE